MKALVAAFNKEKTLVGAFSVITNLRMELFEALIDSSLQLRPCVRMALVPCIAISTGYILLIMFLCELARRTVAPLNDGLVKTALNEAIAAADLCGVCFELIISE